MTRTTTLTSVIGAILIAAMASACSDTTQQKASDAAREAGDAAEKAADARVDASGINVDSDHVTKTVTLKGHVPTEGQKVLAEQIAVAKAVGYRVRNELTVGK